MDKPISTPIPAFPLPSSQHSVCVSTSQNIRGSLKNCLYFSKVINPSRTLGNSTPAMQENAAEQVVQSATGASCPPGGPLPAGIAPRQIVLRDRVTIATVIPFTAPNQVPLLLMGYLCHQLGREIEKGDTYPMFQALEREEFGELWFGVFGAIVILGEVEDGREVDVMSRSGCDWDRYCLGSFHIKPNFPGRSGHVCNGGFLVTDASRNRGVGRLMGELYLEWAPKLGYTYSIFNLVYETNVASCRIWDALGFKRLGRIKGAGRLKSHPEDVDAIIYGRDLGQDDDMVSEERFDKIRFYLKNGKYPNGADRAEKSRLRSAATHYKLVAATANEGEKLMLKGKEVISDPTRQYQIARDVHQVSHGGINKTTASIAESYHWVRIKETVSQVIRNCLECGEMNKGLTVARTGQPKFAPPQILPAMATTSSHPFDADHVELNDNQAQVSATSQYTGFEQTGNGFDMPVDPSLMASFSDPRYLQDLPPSPFLSASRVSQQVADISGPLQGLEADSPMTEIEESPMMVGEELRRRMTRAGYAKQ